MPKLDMVISHSLSQDEAVKRIKNLLSDVKTQFADRITGLHEEWNGNMAKLDFTVMSFPISGTLTVRTSQAQMSWDLPFAAMLFKGKIEATVKERLKTLLA